MSNTGGTGLFSGAAFAAPSFRGPAAAIESRPVSPEVREQVANAVEADMVRVGILEENGSVSPRLQAELGFTVTTCLPTQAIVVKGCLDECSTCEKTREKAIELDLERKVLENKLLAQQIELLEKSQEYRCCPAGQAETGTDGETV